MPGGDGTGPAGMGPMTGRGAGYCAGYPVPGAANPVSGRGYGFGFGRGFGFGFRGGRGGRWAGPYAPPHAAAPTRQQELEALQGEAKYLEDALEGIKKRLAELGAETTKK